MSFASVLEPDRYHNLTRSFYAFLARLAQRIPLKWRLMGTGSLFVLLTTLAISHFPLTLLPNYQIGQAALSDIAVPADLQAAWLEAHPLVVNKPDIIGQLKQHNVLVRAGETITPETLPLVQMIRQYQLSQRHPRRLLGLLIAVLLLYYALYQTTRKNPSVHLSPRIAFWVASSALLVQMLLVRFGLFLAAVLSTRPETMPFGDMLIFQYAIPMAVCALTLTLLINHQVGLVAGLMSALLTGFASSHGLPVAAFALAAVVTAVFSVERYRNRATILHACILVGVVNIVMGLADLLIAEHQLSGQIILGTMTASVIGALLTATVVSFIVPIYESLFHILTDVRLLELSNADLPLLRQLAIEVPGTNHHSHMVGELAEAAAKAIGANALLARIGCLYHDIGKLRAPNMYIENQGGAANPHDRVAPLKSAEIIAGHVRRGIEMALLHKLPPQIIDFIPQHHGTRVITYFYEKARAEASKHGETVDINHFRYPGPKPQTREAAILMLADGAEAAVRSLSERTEENIRAIVKKIIDTVVADGQFDECPLTLRELHLVRESLVQTLKSVHHERISYPGFNPPSQLERERTPPNLTQQPQQA